MEVRKGVPIIVEGLNDLHALSELDIVGQVICIKNSGKNFADLLDSIQSRNIIVFVDFDKTGIDLVKKTVAYFERRKVNVNLNFWRRMRAVIRRNVKDVEGIPSYLEKLKKQASTR